MDGIQISGLSENRVDITFLGDGWGSSQSNNQMVMLDSHINTFFNDVPVYNRYKKFFNIYRANHYRSNPPSNKQTRTNFQYYVDKTNESHPETDVRYVVSDDGGAGEGGNVGLASSRISLTSSDDDNLIGVHELGHGWHRLGDVYEGGGGNFWPNTDNFNRSKWDDWVGYREPYNNEIVNYFAIDQSNYFRCVRDNHTMMGHVAALNWNVVFSPVSREKVVLDIYEFVKPADDWTPNNNPITDPDEISVTTIDNIVIKVDWYLDDALLLKDGGEKFNPADHDITQGNYVLKAHIYDEVIEKAFSDRGGNPGGTSNGQLSDSLDWVRKDLDKLQQEITWNVEFTKDTAPVKSHKLSYDIFGKINSKYIELKNLKTGPYTLDFFNLSGEIIYSIKKPSIGKRTSIEIKQSLFQNGTYIIRFIQFGKLAEIKFSVVN